MALNAPIQGSAADIIKVAMLNVHTAMVKAKVKSRLLLQVHDELIVELAPGEKEVVSEIVKTEMENAVVLSLPLAVNIGTGFSWDLAAH
jgi:DNA polymerase-1